MTHLPAGNLSYQIGHAIRDIWHAIQSLPYHTGIILVVGSILTITILLHLWLTPVERDGKIGKVD